MPMNQFASQKEVLFITYEDVIKTTKLYILKKLLEEEYKSCYKDFIDYSKIEGKNDNDLMGVITASTDINILKYLSISEFDYDVTYTDLLLTYPECIEKSKLLTFGESIHVLMKQSFLNHIYIYSKFYNENIEKDITNNYGTTMISYVTGDFKEAVSSVPSENRITSFILNDINYVQTLLDLDKVAYTNLLVANYGYNYKLNKDGIPILKIDKIDDLGKERIFKLGMFTPDNSATYNTK